MKVQLTNLQTKIEIDEAKFKRTAKKILNYQGVNNAELSILLTDDRGIRWLNKKFRKIDRSTDVLAFSQREGEDFEINPLLLGDVVISVETAQRRAQQLKITEKEESYRYLIHGILHLLGYEHRGRFRQKSMEEREDNILKHLR